jgi:flavin-dependent dehydrogenase
MIYSDIVVVGAGPAGCSAAFYSKYLNDDCKVILFESKPDELYSTYHLMCGEIVRNDLFSEIKPFKKKFVIETIEKIEEHWPGDISIPFYDRGYMIDRLKFQRYMIKSFTDLGGVFINKKIIDISERDYGIKLKTIDGNFIETKYLIDATGANSFIREKIYGKPINTEVLAQYIIEEEPEHGVLHYYYDQKYEGNYKWIFPYKHYTKVGYPILSSSKFEPSGKVITKHARTLGFGGMENYSIRNILFVGDAAAQTNALSKGGIRPAMIAGKMAAEAISQGEPKKYDTLWKKSPFASNLVNEIYSIQKHMSNKDLEDHAKPLLDKNTITRYLRILIFYRKYLKFYDAYNITNKYGW